QANRFLTRGVQIRKFQPLYILHNAPIREFEMKKHAVSPHVEDQRQNHGHCSGRTARSSKSVPRSADAPPPPPTPALAAGHAATAANSAEERRIGPSLGGRVQL